VNEAKLDTRGNRECERRENCFYFAIFLVKKSKQREREMQKTNVGLIGKKKLYFKK